LPLALCGYLPRSADPSRQTISPALVSIKNERRGLPQGFRAAAFHVRKEKPMASHRVSVDGYVRSFAIPAVVIVGLAWSAAGRVPALRASEPPAQTPVAALAPGFTLDGPFTHANLAVYVVRGSTRDAREYITLDEGLAAQTVSVREQTQAGHDRAEVNTLEIENRSGQWLFLQAGHIVKGGKQGRTLLPDPTRPPRSAPQPS